MGDLTSCEVCGMRWTSRLREMCPRCALEDAKRRAEEATARARMLTKERDNWEEMCSDNAERANAAESALASEREARQAAEAQAARLTRVAEDLGRARDEEHAALVSVMERLDAATQRAEEAERALSVAGASLGIDVEIPQDLITHIGVLKGERDAVLAEAEVLRATLLVVSTDLAQDALEDPIGNDERAAAGFYRLGNGAVDAVREALK